MKCLQIKTTYIKKCLKEYWQTREVEYLEYNLTNNLYNTWDDIRLTVSSKYYRYVRIQKYNIN